MKRYNTICSIPGVMEVIDYEPPVVEKKKPSVVDKKFFVPLSEQRNAVFRALTEQDKKRFSFPDGKDDGRDVSMKRRGLDMSELSTSLHNVRSELNEQYSELNETGKTLQKVHNRKQRERAQRARMKRGDQ